MNNVSFLTLPDSTHIAYSMNEGEGPCVIFCSGFKSDMTGSKALALDAFCRQRSQRFIRFDYTGHGHSSGDFRNGTIGQWKRDTLAIIDQLGGEEIILVGSSMGAWLALLAARERMGRIRALIGVSSAPDFTERLIWDAMSDAQKKEMAEKGEFLIPNCYGEEPYPITRVLIEEARHHLLLSSDIKLDMPVRLIHGTKDEDVPWKMSVTLMERLKSSDVQLTLVKDGNHRMSEPAQLKLLRHTLASISE